MRLLTILILVFFASGCSTYPDRLHLVTVKSEIIDNEDNSYFQTHLPSKGVKNIIAPTLVLSVEGDAPFAHIKSEGRQAQFRCYAIDVDGNAITDVEFGRVFFAGLVSPPNVKTNFYPMDDDERYRYRIFLYRGLMARGAGIRPPKFDLLKEDYKHIKCHLVGVAMLSGFMYSNDLLISKEDILSINEKYLAEVRSGTANRSNIDEPQ